MASPKTRGRMLNRDISDSKGFASLSPEAAVLFCMMIPHFNSHGKMNGDSGYVRAVVCPRIPYLTIEKVESSLLEINKHTNVRWFCHDGRYWIHSTKFLSEHQHLNPEKLGEDVLPDFVQNKSGLSSALVAPEVEVEVEVEGISIRRDLSEKRGRASVPKNPLIACSDTDYVSAVKEHYNRLIDTPSETGDWRKFYDGVLNIDDLLFAACTWLIEHPRNRKSKLKQFYGNWLRNAFQDKTQRRVVSS